MSLSLAMGCQARSRLVHVQHPWTNNHPNPLYSSIFYKFTQLLTTRTKLVNWSIESKTLQFQRKVTASFVTTPGSKLVLRSKTGLFWHTSTIRFSTFPKTGHKTGHKTGQHFCHSSHTNNRIVAHPPYQAVQRVVQQSPQRLVKTPLIEDLLDPNRPRNGLIDG